MLLRYWPPTGSEPSGGDRGNHVQRTTLTYYTRKMEVSWQIHDATYLEKRFQSYSIIDANCFPPLLSRFILIDSVSSTPQSRCHDYYNPLHASPIFFLNVIFNVLFLLWFEIFFSTRWIHSF